MKRARRIFGVIDTSLTIAILNVALYWFIYLLQCKYVRVVDKRLEDYSKEISIAMAILVIAISIIMIVTKYYRLKKKKAYINVIWFIGVAIVLFFVLQCIIYHLCSKYDIMNIILNKI